MHERINYQRWARIAGVLCLLSMTCGFFGEVYAPSRLMVSGNAAATAQNIVANDFLFRLGFASYLIEALCDVALALLFYVLLRPVHQGLSLLAAFFGLVSTATYAVGEMFYWGAAVILRNGSSVASFTPPQQQELAFLALRMFGAIGAIVMVFYGFATFFRGFLIFHASYLPHALGLLLMVAGGGFVAKSFLYVLSPALASDFLLLPMFVAGLSLTIWLLVKGVGEVPEDNRARVV